MPFDPITNAEIQSGQPVIGPGGFGQKTKENFDFLNGQIGSVAANDILNGSFEVEDDAISGVPANWDRTLFPGGAGAFDTVVPMHGAQGYKFTHPGGGGNGGGSLQSDFFAIGEIRALLLEWLHYVSAAGMHETVEVAYFTGAQVSVSTQTIYDSTSNPTSPTHRLLPLVIPATARFLKVKVIGGDDDVDVAGDSFWDGVRIVYGVISQAEISASIVGQGELKTASETHTTTAAAALKVLAGGAYCFWFEIKRSGGSGVGYIADAGANGYVSSTTSATFQTTIWIGNSVGNTTSLQSTYVTSSGEVFWFWIMRDKVTKLVIATQSCPDHPCYGTTHDPEKTQHPFGPEYDESKHEIICIQAAQDNKGIYPKWLEDAHLEAKAQDASVSLHDVLMNDYEVDEGSKPVWTDRLVTVGFEEDPNEVRDLYYRGEKATPKRVRINKPSYVLHRSLRKKITA